MNQILFDNVVKPLIPYFISPQSKSDIVDPFTLILKLAIVSYKQIGTKISIGNNKVTIQEPTFLQGSIRTIHGDKKTDLNILQIPILFACKTYLNKCGEIGTTMATFATEIGLKDYTWFFHKAIDGLKILRTTYDSNEIVYTITRLIEVIQSYLDSKPIPEGDPGKELAMKEAIFQNLNTIWNSNSLRMSHILLDRIQKSESTIQQKYIESLERFLEALEEENNVVYNYIFKKVI
jgi:hypothetical protein